MGNKELLILAAKAAGYGEEYQHGGKWMEIRYGYPEAIYSEVIGNEEGSGYWNPLVDDGDALRLAVKLGIQVTPPKHHGDGYVANDVTSFHDDPSTAMRRSIVIAAANIGKGSE